MTIDAYQAVPAALRACRQWLVWQFEQKPGDKKPRKVPYYISGKRRAGVQGSDEDRAALAEFDAVCTAVAGGKFSGIGFAFLPGDGLIGIDIDGAINPETGEISERASAIIAACNSYTEYSPSRKGVHIIVQGQSETFKSNDIGLEVFCGRQFFTVTGASAAAVSTSTCVAFPFSTLDFASMGVDAMVVMPALAFSGS